MANTNKVFDKLNFFYGAGASVVIVGAMFKFLNLDYANVLLAFGLTAEALVFLVSAFEWKKVTKEDEEEEVKYRWENVFPQLVGKKDINHEAIQELTKTVEGYQANTKLILESLEQYKTAITELGNVTQKLSDKSEKVDSQFGEMVDRIEKMNAFYNDMLGAAGRNK